MLTAARNRVNGSMPLNGAPANAPIFSGQALEMIRRMRVNPLPMLNPFNLGIWLDQFDYGSLRMAALLWEAMANRDDTLVTVKAQLENSVASKDWGVFTLADAEPKEAARHKAALEYFYNHLRATDAYDRNERGGLEKFIEQMMRAESYRYAVHHFVWKPMPHKMIEIEGGAPVPAITAEMEYVPLWFFENTTGRLRFLKDGGFGTEGEEVSFDNGQWMCTTGRGLMFAASICYTFKRLTFQDWTIFNERYAQNKVVGTTPAATGSPQAVAMRTLIEAFNQDLPILLTEFQGEPDKLPISLLGPTGSVTVDIFEKFIERQDRKLAAMYRGNDLSTMSRGDRGEQPIGASLQGDEGDAMERGACRRIAGVCQESIDKFVIAYCFGEGVEPLAYFGLPDLEREDTADLRESAGFLADRGARVVLSDIAERLGVQLATNEGDDDILQPAAVPNPMNGEPGGLGRDRSMTANEAKRDLEKFLGPHREAFLKALANDLAPLRDAIEHVASTPNAADQIRNLHTLRQQLPWLAKTMNDNPASAKPLEDLLAEALARGFAEAKEKRG